MKKQPQHYPPEAEEKVAVLRRHLLENEPISKRHGLTTPQDLLAGRQQEIHAERERKLDAARKERQVRRQQAA